MSLLAGCLQLRGELCSHGIKLIFGLFALGILGPQPVAAEPSVRPNLGRCLARLGYEQIELRRTGGNRLFLFGKLDGRRSSILVDTGWSFSTVSTNAARRLGPYGPGGALGHDFFPTNHNVSAALIGNLELARVELPNQPALVQHMVVNGRPAPFDVVLGCDFLLRNFCVLDCLNRRLYVRRSAPSEAEQKRFDDVLRRDGFNAIPLQRKEPLALTCAASVNGENLELLVDSAAPWTCLDTRESQRLGLKAIASPARITGVGGTGTRSIGVAAMKSFQLGSLDVKIRNLAVFDLADWGFAAPGAVLSEVQGILGADALNAASAVIDFQALRLWVKPASRKR